MLGIRQMASCSVTSWNILPFRATQTFSQMTRAHLHVHSPKAHVFIHRERCYRGIGESRAISHANDRKASTISTIPRRGIFSTETPLERERRLEIQLNGRTEYQQYIWFVYWLLRI